MQVLTYNRNIFCDWLTAAISAVIPLFAEKGSTFSADVKVVNVLATVRNVKGEIVRDLSKDDFSGMPVQARDRSSDAPGGCLIATLIRAIC